MSENVRVVNDHKKRRLRIGHLAEQHWHEIQPGLLQCPGRPNTSCAIAVNQRGLKKAPEPLRLGICGRRSDPRHPGLDIPDPVSKQYGLASPWPGAHQRQGHVSRLVEGRKQPRARNASWRNPRHGNA